MKWQLIAQGNGATTLSAALSSVVKHHSFDRLDVAVAYATRQGIKALEQALGGLAPQSRWVIGLDDAVTQPEAIEYLMKVEGAHVRLASMTPARRFHPKLYCTWSSTQADRCVSAIGSGNMTARGLQENGETATILSAESKEEAEQLRAQWAQMWALGSDATQTALDAYREKYKVAKKQRKPLVDLGIAPPEPDADADSKPLTPATVFGGDPATARVAWVEAGSASAAGKDLEFPQEMMPFFGLHQSPEERKLRINGQVFTRPFTMRHDNQMWRLMFSSDAVHAAIGRDDMRPLTGGNRSDLAVVFEKIAGTTDFHVRMVPIGSAAHQALIDQSTAAKGLRHTMKITNPKRRLFGFY